MMINNVHELMESLRHGGKYAWPGGYPKFWATDDGEALSYEAMIENIWRIARAVRDQEKSGWCVWGCDVNWEDRELYCAHTGERIESAYAEDDSET